MQRPGWGTWVSPSLPCAPWTFPLRLSLQVCSTSVLLASWGGALLPLPHGLLGLWAWDMKAEVGTTGLGDDVISPPRAPVLPLLTSRCQLLSW